MRKLTLVLGIVVVLAVVCCMNAYADDGSGWHNFWGAVGGFFYNALPWNWHNWAGK